MIFELPKQVEKSIHLLETAGYEAYVVGGCVRDFLLGREINDYDVAASSTPEETKNVFSGFAVIETGIKHGTVTVIIDGMPVEITTFRTEHGYTDNRRPDRVEFTKSLKNDLARRDFTINAIAYNYRVGFCDYYGGTDDLKNGIIRCVGDADKRFGEDALRILRALRFSSVLGFEFDPETRAAAIKKADLLKKVSAERVAEELKKLICGVNSETVLMWFRDIFTVIIPELSGSDVVYGHLVHTAGSAENNLVIRLAALFHDLGLLCGETENHAEKSAETADTLLRRLKFDNETRKRIVRLIKEHEREISFSDNEIKKALNLLGETDYFNLLKLKYADGMDKNEYLMLRDTAIGIIERGECYNLKTLAVNGRDILSCGVRAGHDIGKTLDELLELVIDGKLENKKEELLAYIIKGQ